MTGYTSLRDSTILAENLIALVIARRNRDALAPELAAWLNELDPARFIRLIEMKLAEPKRVAEADIPLIEHLEGRIDGNGVLTFIGWKQAMEAKGNTPEHCRQCVNRVKRIIDGCGFIYWRDLIADGAATTVQVFVGGLRAAKEITGLTLNYFVREFKSFCRWMKKEKRAPVVAMEELEKVGNAETDATTRRALSVDEMILLIQSTAQERERAGLTGEERGLLYRFCFETGMRPKEARALTVADFDLKASPPVVMSHARYVKRRKVHRTVLRPALAQLLAQRFKNKLPMATAIRMASRFHLAEMLQDDLKDARQVWIDLAPSAEAREGRLRSDFPAAKSHSGAVAVFYSLRHAHGTALALAGVAEAVIATSMLHSSRKTTERHLHAFDQNVAAGIALLPEFGYSPRPTDAKAG